MSDSNRLLRRVRWRAAANDVIHKAGSSVLFATIAAIILLAVDRLFALHLPGGLFLGVALSGILIGLVLVAIHRPTRNYAAMLIDRRMHLKDRFASAEAVEQGRVRDAVFAPLLNRDVQRLAGSIDPRSVMPLRVSPIWVVAILLLVGLWLGVAYVPALDLHERSIEVQGLDVDPAFIAQRQRDVQTIQETAAQLQEQPAADERLQEELAELDALAAQMSGDGSSNNADSKLNRDEAAARIEQAAERLTKAAERDIDALDEVTDRFTGIKTPDTPMSTDELREALKRGEFGQAADEIERLLAEHDAEADSIEREETAQQLRQLSDSIENAAEKQPDDLGERREQLRQTLRDQGVEESTIDQLLDEQSSETRNENPIDELNEQNLDEEVARKLARELQLLRDEQAVDEQAKQDMEQLSDALRDSADELNSTPETSAHEQTDQTDQTDINRDQPDDSQREQTSEVESGSEPETGTESRTEKQKTTEDQQQPRAAEGNQETPSKAVNPDSSSSKPTDNADSTGDQTASYPGAEDQAREDQAQQTTSRENEATDPDGELSETQSRQSEQNQSNDMPPIAVPSDDVESQQLQPNESRQSDQQIPDSTPKSGADQTPDTSDENATPDQLPDLSDKSPAEILREMQKRREAAEQNKQASEQLRELAKKLADNMSEEDRERWARYLRDEMNDQRGDSTSEADQNERENGTGIGDGLPAERDMPRKPVSPYQPTDVENLQIGADDDQSIGSVLAEWLDDRALANAPNTQRQKQSVDRLKRAQRNAERSMEDSTVPSRYHRLIRKYFDRLNSTAQRAEDSPSAPQDAGDE